MLFRHEHDYDALVDAAAQGYGVPANLVRGVIARESQFNARAIRGEPQMADASRGLMQLLYSTAQGLGFNGQPDDLFTPGVNVPLGVRYLAEQYRLAKNWAGAVSAYNGGWRPGLGFGRPAVAATRVCLARNEKTGECVNWHDVRPGEYANQDYVNAVMKYYTYFETGKYPTSAAGILIPAAAMLAAVAFLH